MACGMRIFSFAQRLESSWKMGRTSFLICDSYSSRLRPAGLYSHCTPKSIFSLMYGRMLCRSIFWITRDPQNGGLGIGLVVEIALREGIVPTKPSSETRFVLGAAVALAGSTS